MITLAFLRTLGILSLQDEPSDETAHPATDLCADSRTYVFSYGISHGTSHIQPNHEPDCKSNRQPNGWSHTQSNHEPDCKPNG